MKNLSRLFTLLSVALLLAVAPGCSKAEFQLANLAVTPGEVAAGENATVSLDISNTGNGAGESQAVLNIDGVQSANKTVSVGPGNTQNVTFAIVENRPGRHTVSVDNLTATLVVLRPAEFSVTDLKLDPADAALDSPVKVTATVANTGEVAGTYPARLLVDGRNAGSREMAISPNSTLMASFTLTSTPAGSHEVSLGAQKKTLNIIDVPKLISDAAAASVKVEAYKFTMNETVSINETWKQIGGMKLQSDGHGSINTTARLMQMTANVTTEVAQAKISTAVDGYMAGQFMYAGIAMPLAGYRWTKTRITEQVWSAQGLGSWLTCRQRPRRRAS